MIVQLEDDLIRYLRSCARGKLRKDEKVLARRRAEIRPLPPGLLSRIERGRRALAALEAGDDAEDA